MNIRVLWIYVTLFTGSTLAYVTSFLKHLRKFHIYSFKYGALYLKDEYKQLGIC